MSRFFIESLLSQTTDKLRREPFCVPKNFWYPKKMTKKEGQSEGGREGGRQGGREGRREGGREVRRDYLNFCQEIDGS